MMFILTPSTFVDLCEEIYGHTWPSQIADELGRSLKTIKRWRSGATRIPSGVRAKMLQILDEKIRRLDAFKGG